MKWTLLGRERDEDGETTTWVVDANEEPAANDERTDEEE